MEFKKLFSNVDFKVLLITFAFFFFRLLIDFSTPFPSKSSYAFIEEAKAMLHGRIPIVGLTIPKGYPTFPFMIYIYFPFTIFNEAAGIKILDSIIYAILLPVVFLLLDSVIKDEALSLIGATITMMFPYHSLFVNTASINLVSILLYILTLYLFIQRKFFKTDTLITLLLILSLATPLAIIVAFSMLIYVILERLSSNRVDRVEAELSIFYFLFTIWKTLIMYKDVIIGYSPLIHNLSSSQIASSTTSFLAFFSNYVFIPVYFIIGFFGSFLIYKNNKKVAKILILNAILLAITMLSNIIHYPNAIFILLFLFSPFVIYFIKSFLDIQIKITKKAISSVNINIKRYTFFKTAFSLFITIMLVLLFILNIETNKSMAKENSPSINEVECLKEMSKLNKKNIACLNRDSFFVHYYSKKTPILMRYGILTPEEKEKEKLIREMITTPLDIRALEIAKVLDVDYIFISKEAIENASLRNHECFREICNYKDVIAYEILC